MRTGANGRGWRGGDGLEAKSNEGNLGLDRPELGFHRREKAERADRERAEREWSKGRVVEGEQKTRKGGREEEKKRKYQKRREREGLAPHSI
ncbi:hypothetical protein Scep_028316 [Stephania cephalantha]|uniref:Uncharacterized protein n=1 Tax=Stephania cephalantha TaxID=152367 RepID=A0AAP0HJG6_9MAGN